MMLALASPAQYRNQSDQMIRKKSAKFFENCPKSCQIKKAKKSTTKLNLKTQNINIKPLKTLKYLQQIMF
jgi:hypothetical protein